MRISIIYITIIFEGFNSIHFCINIKITNVRMEELIRIDQNMKLAFQKKKKNLNLLT